MKKEKVYQGFVRTEDYSQYFVQIQDNNQWGFSLCSDDQSWPGGFGAAPNGTRWVAVPREEVPPEVEEELGWILDEYESEEEEEEEEEAD